MKTPPYIENAGIRGAPIQYKWAKSQALQYLEVMDSKSRLFLAVEKSLARAQYALGLAAAEWTVRRLEEHADTTDSIHRIEAAWAKVVHPAYAKELKFNMAATVFSSVAEVNGPLRVATFLVQSLDSRLRRQKQPVAETTTNQGNLARHVVPDQSVFDAWIQEAVRRCAQYFPNTGDPYLETSLPVVRELCDPAFDYTPEAAEDAKQAFLGSLDWKINPHLNSPDEMKALGFAGVPYAG